MRLALCRQQFEADQQFFERGLDAVDVVVHGRHSKEKQRRSDLRRRLILSRRIRQYPATQTIPRLYSGTLLAQH
jgi:hypothetical protein